MSFFAVKTTVNQEKAVANLMELAVRKDDLRIYSILAPRELRGYVLVEAETSDDVERAIRGIPHARGLIKGETSFEEVEHFLTPKKTVASISEGSIVEIISGPFKGEKARVKRVDHTHEEITVELIDAVVPIPVTVRGDHVRVIDMKEGE
jgi:transcriptional antiterminator NusG